jgi:hypothetical protein
LFSFKIDKISPKKQPLGSAPGQFQSFFWIRQYLSEKINSNNKLFTTFIIEERCKRIWLQSTNICTEEPRVWPSAKTCHHIKSKENNRFYFLKVGKLGIAITYMRYSSLIVLKMDNHITAERKMRISLEVPILRISSWKHGIILTFDTWTISMLTVNGYTGIFHWPFFLRTWTALDVEFLGKNPLITML